MTDNFVNTVAKLSRSKAEDLASLTHKQLIDQIILPLIVQPGGQDTRGWHIGDNFMELMAEFGRYCYIQDPESAAILLEIALQRLSKGAVLHESTSFDVLPPQYRKYSAQYDQYGLMSNACWNFLRNQANTCFRCDSLTRDHVKKIIFGLLDHIDADGNTGDYTLEYEYLNASALEIRAWALKTAEEEIPLMELVTHFATPTGWRKWKPFFKEHWDAINKEDFFRRIKARGFLGGYFQRKKITKEILA